MFDLILEASSPGLSKAKRKKMEDLIYDFFSTIEPSGVNTKYYKEFFSKMSDKEFNDYFKYLFDHEDEYILLHISDYEYSLELTNITKTLSDVLNRPLMEYVVMPEHNKDKDNPTISPTKVPVGYIHLKRMQQTLSKKNKSSTSADKRSALTGQVTGKDKNGRMVDTENYNFIVSGADDIMKEFMSLRGDDNVMLAEALASVAEKGYIDMSELTDKKENKTTLNIVDTYLIGMGLKSDLVTDNLTLVMSLKD